MPLMNNLQNKDTDVYFEHKSLKEHQKEMVSLMRKTVSLKTGSFLDLACAGGIFANAFKDAFPTFEIKGIDLDSKLIAKAKQDYPALESSFSCENCRKISSKEKFEVVHASGILSVFEDFEETLTEWIDLLSEDGKLFLFNRFNSKDVDVLIKHRNNTKGYGWETGLNTFSIETLKRYLDGRNLRHSINKFSLPIDLPEHPDPIRSFTQTLSDQSRLVVNGANIITEHFLAVIFKN
jgi:trans-aconitate methyltransferase